MEHKYGLPSSYDSQFSSIDTPRIQNTEESYDSLASIEGS